MRFFAFLFFPLCMQFLIAWELVENYVEIISVELLIAVNNIPELDTSNRARDTHPTSLQENLPLSQSR